VPQCTSRLAIYVLQACLDGIEFDLALTPEFPPYSEEYPQTSSDEQLRNPTITAATPVPRRKGGGNWKNAILRLDPFNVIRWKDEDVPPLNSPAKDHIVLQQRLKLTPAWGALQTAGTQRWHPLSCPSGPYPQPRSGYGEKVSDYRRFRLNWNRKLKAGDEVAISFEGFKAGRASVEYIVFIHDGLLDAAPPWQDASTPDAAGE